MTLPVIVLGGGGHAKVLIDVLLIQSVNVIGITDSDVSHHGNAIRGIPIVGNDNVILDYPPASVQLVNGLGSVGPTTRRKCLFDKFKSRDYSFATVIHPSAVIASDVQLSEGVQIMAGAIIQPGSYIGNNTIVNTRASIDHDCRIGDHCHLSPGVILSGNVSVGNGTHIGTGATVIQGITIGSNCLIAAGSVVVKNIENNKKVKGIPAKED